ncbi:N-acetyltransferase [Cyanobium sp. FACHB-13342]|uniref:N-acetyltransferase n=1 Tax=Cyanobium sp. FACHB-13342 TaxID=2692793 RepID=UPI001680B85B|nr:N-acetyltransferase [Cyanobium sp. FACHB-13342]MBD2422424.1 N-acetyltransferase [Cyanobium sp. FACHB-13342]
MIPFRSQPPAPRLREGYRLVADGQPSPAALNRLLLASGDRARDAERWHRVLERSIWHLAVESPEGELVGFVRATSDLALNANLWDLCSDPADPGRGEILAVLVHGALGRLRRELAGCSISLSAPPEALAALERHGFAVDPGGIRAMGLQLES